MKRRTFLGMLASLPFGARMLRLKEATIPVVAGEGLATSPLANTVSAPPPVTGQFWYRCDLANGDGVGRLYYRDNSGNTVKIGDIHEPSVFSRGVGS